MPALQCLNFDQRFFLEIQSLARLLRIDEPGLVEFGQ